ncbi:unnamed protein product, partial [Scytosiphon promiscuus]
MSDEAETPAKKSNALTNADVVSNVADFSVPGQFIFLAPVSRTWREAWGKRPTATLFATPDTSLPQLRHGFDCGLPRDRVGVCAAIARLGDAELLECARAHGCPWGEKTCARAAASGSLATLQHARHNGCPWDDDT